MRLSSLSINRIIQTVISIIKFLNHLPSVIICYLRSIYYSSKIDEGDGRILINKPFQRLSINKNKNSVLRVKGILRIVPFYGSAPIIIQLKEDSRLNIENDFTIGQGVRIILTKGSFLSFGGRCNEMSSGITSNTYIMVKKSITVGKDFVCSWDVFISDCDWHYIEGQNYNADIIIGDHVWVANNNNILKGTIIGNNCIVASCSKTSNRIFPQDSLVGGIPAKILKENIKWHKDLIP